MSESNVLVIKSETIEKYRVDVGGYWLDVEVQDRKVLTLYNEKGKLDFAFLNSAPEIVEAVGRAIVAAAQIITTAKV